MIAGGFGAGKTTMVRVVSEIEPLSTDGAMTTVSRGIDEPGEATRHKHTTTVALDFGRLTLDTDVVLYLFGTPGQSRFWFMWDQLAHGALGGVVLLDSRRLADSFAAIDFFEDQDLPYVVAINRFDGVQPHDIEDVREALTIRSDIPLLSCDARDRDSVKAVLISLVEYVLRLRTSAALAG
ncbi:MAG: GTP-binding protein [Mycobacteriales bacterium]